MSSEEGDEFVDEPGPSGLFEVIKFGCPFPGCTGHRSLSVLAQALPAFRKAVLGEGRTNWQKLQALKENGPAKGEAPWFVFGKGKEKVLSWARGHVLKEECVHRDKVWPFTEMMCRDYVAQQYPWLKATLPGRVSGKL